MLVWLVQHHGVEVQRMVGRAQSHGEGRIGEPPPQYQWQYSTDGGKSWMNVAGGTAPGWSQECTPSMNGWLFRALGSNTQGNTASTVAAVTVTSGG